MPAVTSGPGTTVIITVSASAEHPPLKVEVSINIIGEAEVSEFVGV